MRMDPLHSRFQIPPVMMFCSLEKYGLVKLPHFVEGILQISRVGVGYCFFIVLIVFITKTAFNFQIKNNAHNTL